MARRFPTTFAAPTKASLERLAPGDSVHISAKGERFWARVESVEGDDVKATVRTKLLLVPLRYGQIVHFKKRHVHAILKPYRKPAKRT